MRKGIKRLAVRILLLQAIALVTFILAKVLEAASAIAVEMVANAIVLFGTIFCIIVVAAFLFSDWSGENRVYF